MNNAKLWLVVQPTVGIPLFLSAVAIGSFAVHLAVLSKTNWYEDYLLGKPLGSSATAALNAPDAEAPVARASLAALKNSGAQTVLITLADGTTTRAVIELPATLTAARLE